MKRSWIIPSLGGWLSIANLVMFFTLIVWVKTAEVYPQTVFAVLLCALTLPLAIFWVLPYSHGPTYVDVFVLPLVIVINAFIWGYGIAWLWKYATKLDDLSDQKEKMLDDAHKKTPAARV